ncbi:SxtJ family membrane protein [Janthinobacterium sp. UMAB-56]|uniref:SxtJ family membrane protein n=1 Tax=Janthinobacterium sp. UMAB-56 TaxID=1365361 RepID=UPI001C5A1C08|nr:SxtJ family membrane protein [Janthinobacterium sp. UMAB-56]
MSNRVFGLVWCLIIGSLSLRPLLHGETVHVPPAVVAVLLALIALAAPGLLDRPNRLWTYFGKKLHAATSNVALFVIYFFFLTPGAALLRLCGRRQLKLQFDSKTQTYWTERTSGDTNFNHPY